MGAEGAHCHACCRCVTFFADPWGADGKYTMTADLLEKYSTEELAPFLFRHERMQRACQHLLASGGP
eukprot:scaffold646906_cov42-Prasinocladus_malaysianus.AAC.1